MPEEVNAEKIEPNINPGGGTVFIETREKPPREFYIRKADADKHGYTRGCGGCSSWSRGLARQPHTEVCRNRFEDIFKRCGESR